MHRYLPSSPLGLFQAAVKAATLLPRSDLMAERDLLLTKWFPYRFTSPMEATYQFAVAFRAARANYLGSDWDIESAEQARRGPQFAAPQAPSIDFTTMWRARQRADAYCIPYELYLEFCFWFAGRRRRRQVLRPNQCGPSTANWERWFDAFERFLEDRASLALSQVADVPQFDVRHYRGLPAQDALLAYLEAEMTTSDRPWPDLIGTWSLERGLFPLLRFRRLVPSDLNDVFSRARTTVFAGWKPMPPSVPEAGFWQSCYGQPGALDLSKPQCKACPQARGCSEFAARVEQEVKLRTGHTDPVAAHQREQGRLRKAKHDSNKKRAPEASTEPEVTLSEIII